MPKGTEIQIPEGMTKKQGEAFLKSLMAKKEDQVTAEITLPPGMTREEFQKVIDRFSQASPETKASDPGFVLFGEWEIGVNQKRRVYRDTFKGKEYLNIRTWYQGDDGFWAPGKGATFFFEEIDRIIEGLRKMQEWYEEHPKGK